MEQAGADAGSGTARRRLGEAASSRGIALAALTLLPLYLGLTLGYRDSVPLFEGPDEPSHLHYAVLVHGEGRLPRADPVDVPGAGAQPPLAYLVAAPLLGASGVDLSRADEALGALGRRVYYGEAPATEHGAVRFAPERGRRFAGDGSLSGLRILRSASLAFGLLAVIFTFAAVWRVGRDARLALLAAALLAFNPQFLFASATFSNDTAAAAIGAATLWMVFRALEEGGPSRIHYAAGALLCGLGILTKLSTLPVLAAAAATIVAVDGRPQRDRRIDLALAIVLVLLLAGPYLAWSLEERGGFLGLDAALGASEHVLLPEDLGGVWTYLTRVYWDRTFASYWVGFGWPDLRVPKGVYLAFFALTWTGALGYFAGRVSEPNALLRTRALRGHLVLAVVLTLVAHLGLNLTIVACQGRHLFAAAPQISLVIALGFGRLLGHEQRTLPLTVAVVAALLVLALYCLRTVLVPAYAGA